MRICRTAYLIVSLFLIAGQAVGQTASWATHYEQSDFTETPRYAETMQFIQRLDAYSDNISSGVFGISPQGRELLYVVYDRDGLTHPQAIRDAGRIILMVQACVHPGESEGKDAMLVLLRDLVDSKLNTALFNHVSLLFVPIFNVDGHERFSAYGRINQNGPKEMGWRTTAQNLNLNRDFVKADAPEMQAWLRLYNQWQPEFFIDTHTSNGADYQYVITYALETGGNMEKDLTEWQKNIFLPAVEKKMEKVGFPMFKYVSFRRWHDPRSGLIYGVASPMFSQGYTAVRNRPGLLVETHMLKPYKQRVESTKEIIIASLELLNTEHQQLKKLIRDADLFVSSKAFRDISFPLKFEVDMKDSVMLPFKGVAYKVEKSDLTNGDWFVYNNRKPEQYNLAFFGKSKPSVKVQLPEAYIIPIEWEEVTQRLSLHNIGMFTLDDAMELEVNIDKFSHIEWQRSPYEGRHRVSKMKFETHTKKVLFPKGSVVVPMNQPLAKLIAQMLEPQGSGSLLEWGFFNSIFEQKEYAESYVMEPLARKMLDSIPGLRAEFEEKKQSDNNFAANAWMQLNWFYSKTPWWDQKYMVYPVGRIMQAKNLPAGQTRMPR